MGEAVSRLEAFFGIGVFEKGVVVMVSYGRTFNPVEHINPLMVLEGGTASHAVACWEDWESVHSYFRAWHRNYAS